jgi:hypothetical protein
VCVYIYIILLKVVSSLGGTLTIFDSLGVDIVNLVVV